MERVCLLYWAFVVLIYVVSLTGAEETEPMCFSRWDYEHKMLRQLSKMEDKLEHLTKEIKLLKDKGNGINISIIFVVMIHHSHCRHQQLCRRLCYRDRYHLHQHHQQRFFHPCRLR